MIGDTQNKLKLGLFAFNLDGGFTATTIPERYRLSWDNVRDVGCAADKAGFDALIPWRAGADLVAPQTFKAPITKR
jgi:hypothetical protein